MSETQLEPGTGKGASGKPNPHARLRITVNRRPFDEDTLVLKETRTRLERCGASALLAKPLDQGD